MKENKEWERTDIAIDRDMEVDCDIGQEITCYIETWFDVDEKFGLHINDEDGAWLNLYGKYNPFADSLRLECEISRDDGSSYFDYEPTKAESQLIKEMITQKIREEYDQTPQEFCNSAMQQDEEVFVYKNTRNFSLKRMGEQDRRLKEHIEANDYVNGGSMSIALPMSMAGEHYRDMIAYCQSHHISKIVIENHRDIAGDNNTVRRILNDLCDKGLSVELAALGITYAPASHEQELPEEEPDEEITMGGM